MKNNTKVNEKAAEAGLKERRVKCEEIQDKMKKIEISYLIPSLFDHKWPVLEWQRNSQIDKNKKILKTMNFMQKMIERRKAEMRSWKVVTSRKKWCTF